MVLMNSVTEYDARYVTYQERTYIFPVSHRQNTSLYNDILFGD